MVIAWIRGNVACFKNSNVFPFVTAYWPRAMGVPEQKNIKRFAFLLRSSPVLFAFYLITPPVFNSFFFLMNQTDFN